MSSFNSQHNRVVWIDIPVADLDRSAAFYRAVLAIGVHQQEFGEFKFCVLDHHEGNGGCLVLKPGEVSATGTMIYLMHRMEFTNQRSELASVVDWRMVVRP